jgi:biotin carboxyl carrier protein
MKEPFNIQVNDRFQFEITPDQARALDIISNGENAFHALENGHSYQIQVIEANYGQRFFELDVNGHRFKVHITDYYERLIQQMGLNVVTTQKQNTIKAPMPGLVIGIAVTTGHAVQKGDTLIILEAMKMENVIKAAFDGVVKSIQVEKGTAVEKGQLLLEME